MFFEQKINRRIIAALTSATLAACMIPCASAYAVEVSEIEAAKAKAEEIRITIDQLQTDLNVATEEYENSVIAYNDAIKGMRDAQERYDVAEARIDELQTELSKTASTMYKRGNATSYIDVLLGANTFNDFVNGLDMFSRISGKEADLIQESKDLRTEADEAKAEYESKKQIAADEMAKAQEKQIEIVAKQAELAEEAQQISEDIEAMESQYELEAEAARKAAMAAQAAMSAYAETLKPGESIDVGSGYFANPCPDSWESSGWGYRSWDNKFHLGTDMAANMGAPIYAAESGTVIKTSTSGAYNGGAGNYVTIAHGNGLVTKYFHLSAAFVSPGDTVKRGQNIAAVGSTGKSTGPHLHFQVEINGVAVCPYDFL